MKLLRCENNHFFDADKFETCPYCLQLMGHEERVTVPLYSDMKHKTAPLTVQEYPSAETPIAPVTPITPMTPIRMPDDVIDMGEDEPQTAFGGNADEKTVGYYASLIGVEPVVGWLVCIRGEYYGDQFKLKSGRNFIGRGPDMDVVLSLDPKVSRNRHAIITYEPRGRRFFVQPGDARELFYLNDEVVLNNMQLQGNDVLTLGSTKLMFIPCCSERFSWEDVKNEEVK